MTIIKSIQNKLSQHNTEEISILEDMEIRTYHLCAELRLKQDQHLSWVDLCNILSPANPTKIAEKIYRHYNKTKNDDLFYDIYNAIEDIGSNDAKFWHCDTLYFNSISNIIHDNFKNEWQFIIENMNIIHRQLPSFDIEELFTEAVLTMREQGLIGNELFSCEVKVRDNSVTYCENADYGCSGVWNEDDYWREGELDEFMESKMLESLKNKIMH